MTDLLTPEQIATLRQRAERAEAEHANCGRCGAFLVMGGEQCVRENDHKGLHYFENEYAPSNEALLLRAELQSAQSTIAELNATVERTDKERIELAKMLLHYVRSVPLGNQPHMSAEIAEKMALVALGES